MAAELAKTLGPTPDTVIPAQAGIQGIGMESCRVFLDSRLRGNDGVGRRCACGAGLDSRFRGNDGREGNDGSRSFRRAHAKGILERQIAATDEEIDSLVYESHELTEEGIAIID